MNQLLSAEETAKLLGISKWTLAMWRCKRKIPYIKLGGRTLFDPEDLKLFVESCKVEMG